MILACWLLSHLCLGTAAGYLGSGRPWQQSAPSSFTLIFLGELGRKYFFIHFPLSFCVSLLSRFPVSLFWELWPRMGAHRRVWWRNPQWGGAFGCVKGGKHLQGRSSPAVVTQAMFGPRFPSLLIPQLLQRQGEIIAVISWKVYVDLFQWLSLRAELLQSWV